MVLFSKYADRSCLFPHGGVKTGLIAPFWVFLLILQQLCIQHRRCSLSFLLVFNLEGCELFQEASKPGQMRGDHQTISGAPSVAASSKSDDVQYFPWLPALPPGMARFSRAPAPSQWGVHIRTSSPFRNGAPGLIRKLFVNNTFFSGIPARTSSKRRERLLFI